jgi:hypothetical protein
LVLFLEYLLRPSWRAALLTGAGAGAALAVRPGGIVLLIPIAGVALLWTILFRSNRDATDSAPLANSEHPLQATWRRHLLHFMVAAVIAWTMMVIVWPYALGNPLLHPIEAIRVAMKFPYDFAVFVEGHVVHSTALPRHYLPKYILITTPLPVLFFAAIGILAAIVHQVRQPRSSAALVYCLAESWLLVPLAAFVVHPPCVYDGMRHFLFLFPAIAFWQAIGIVALWRRAGRIALLLSLAVTLLPVIEMARLHPYEMTYFNALTGGVAGAERQYDTEYWGTSYREAMLWINDLAQREPQRRIRVLASGPHFLAKQYAAANVEITRVPLSRSAPSLPDGFDFYLGTTRKPFDKFYPKSPIVHSVGREGATFCVIRASQKQ